MTIASASGPSCLYSQSTVSSCELNACSLVTAQCGWLRTSSGGVSLAPRDRTILMCAFAPTSRCLQRASTSNKPSDSERFVTSVAIGYQATYPAPRTAENVGAIWSQSVLVATLSGVPMRVSLVASSWITPSYATSRSVAACGATGAARVTTASDNPPV